MNRKRITLGGIILAIILAILVVGVKQAASATGDETPEPCVPAEAWTETIEHPAVTEVVEVIDQEAIPPTWANFQPNNHKEPFVGPPSYPSDPRGSWNVHNQIPGGHEGPNGVYSKGNPHKGGNWFYRDAGSAQISHPETVIVEEAWTEYIEHPEVVCEEEPEEPTECPRFSVPNADGECEVPPCPEDDPNRTDCVPTDEPEISTVIKTERECISETEVKITTYESTDGGDWVDIGASFEPATARDNCKVDVPGATPDDDTAHHVAVTKVYTGGEEGM